MKINKSNKRSKTHIRAIINNTLQAKGTSENVILKKKRNSFIKKAAAQGKGNNSFVTSGSKKVLSLKAKGKNKIKTLVQPYKLLPDHDNKLTFFELKDMISSLVSANTSAVSQRTPKLYQVILRALKDELPWYLIESILQECNQKAKIDKNNFFVQLTFEKKIFMLIGFRSNNMLKVKRNLLPILKKYNCSKEPVLEHFKCDCRIEALAPYQTASYFADFETNLSKDAVSVKAEGVEIKDYETGAVCFQSNPLEMPYMVEQLDRQNYKVLFTHCGFEAIDKITLNSKEKQRYKMLLYELLTFKEIEKFYDNIEDNEDHSELNKIKEK